MEMAAWLGELVPLLDDFADVIHLGAVAWQMVKVARFATAIPHMRAIVLDTPTDIALYPYVDNLLDVLLAFSAAATLPCPALDVGVGDVVPHAV